MRIVELNNKTENFFQNMFMDLGDVKKTELNFAKKTCLNFHKFTRFKRFA